MSTSPLSPRSLQELETQIVGEYRAQTRAAIGDRKVKIFEDDPLYTLVSDRLAQLVEKFPQTSDKKRFIGSYCTVTPKLVVRLDAFKTQEVDGNLFVVEKNIVFGPLVDPVLGSITTKDIALRVRNIRKLDKEPVENEFAVQQEPDERKCILLNEDITIGYVNSDPSMVKTQILADVEFGEFLDAKNVYVDVETAGEESTTYLVFKLPPMEGKINSIGTVTLKNDLLSKDLSLKQLEELIQSTPDLSIDRQFNADAPFFPVE